MYGMIKLADSSLFTVANSVCLPGVVPISNAKWPEIKNVKKTFLLSGVLTEEIAMLSTVLDTFAKLSDCELHITGSKGNEQMLNQYAAKYTNIHWHGQLPFIDYLELLHTISFQLSMRDTRFPENQCNFPSKIMEALHHNRIIISTIHYPQLEGVKYFTVNPAKETLAHDIKAITNLQEAVLLSYANQSELVSNRFSVKVWNNAMTRIEKGGI